MKRSEIFHYIKASICAETNYLSNTSQLNLTTTWDELDLDSIDSLNLIMSLEYVLNIQIPDIDFAKFFNGTIEDSIKIIEELMRPFE